MGNELSLPYVPIDPRIEKHPKTRKLLRILGMAGSRFAHMHVVKFLMEVGELHPDGKLGNLDPEEVADMACWDGDATKFTDAMCDAGWLMFGEGGYVVVGWEDYGGRVHQARVEFRNAKTTATNVRWHNEGKHDDGPKDGCPLCLDDTKPIQTDTDAIQNDTDVYTGHTKSTEPEPEGEPKPETTSKSKALSGKPDRSAEILDVFAHYRTHHPRAHPKPSSKSKEWRNIRDRLAEGHSVGEICSAINGYHLDPFHCGDNDRSTAFLGLELITRLGSNIVKGIEWEHDPPRKGLTRKGQEMAKAIAADQDMFADVSPMRLIHGTK